MLVTVRSSETSLGTAGDNIGQVPGMYLSTHDYYYSVYMFLSKAPVRLGRLKNPFK